MVDVPVINVLHNQSVIDLYIDILIGNKKGAPQKESEMLFLRAGLCLMATIFFRGERRILRILLIN
jgi:hypothetical protein